MGKIAAGLAFAVLLLAGCQTITEKLPTEATGTPRNGVLTIAIPTITATPGGATVRPTPTPAAGPMPAPSPSPTPGPTTNGCKQPLSGEVTRVNVKIHIRGPNRYTLDSTPLVGPDAAYCREIGFTDGRLWCPVRPEGHPEREICEEYAVGYAKDTKRQGPTWYINGKFCDGNTCDNHENNQYLLYAYAGGRYEACVKNDTCGAVDVDR